MKIKVFGFGNSGNNILNCLMNNSFRQDDLFYFDTDKEAFEKSQLINKFLIGEKQCLGTGTNANVKTGKAAYTDDLNLFKNLTKDKAIYIVVGGFGGGTFSGMCGEITALLHKSNMKFFIVASFPLNFEGEKRIRNSFSTISEVNSLTDKVIIVKTEELKKQFSNLSVAEIFSRCDHIIKDAIKEIISADKNNGTIQTNPGNNKIEESILLIKKYLDENDFFISSDTSKVIIPETNKQLLQAIDTNPDLVYSISPRKFEELVSYIYELAGYKIKLTKESRDDGADILVWTPPPVLGNNFLTVVQAKRYKQNNKVGSIEVREIIGTKMVFEADKAQIVTTSDFSKPAIKTAKAQKIDLLKFYELNNTIKTHLYNQV